MTTQQLIPIIGRVLRPPEVRTAICSKTMRTVPVLQIELGVDGIQQPVMVEQEFPFAEVNGAHAAARRYRKGSVLRVEVDHDYLQLIYRKVAHIKRLDALAA